MRFIASQLPLSTPCLRKASTVYSEQVGKYRQLGGNKGLIMY
jgi:hypothetical protein